MSLRAVELRIDRWCALPRTAIARQPWFDGYENIDGLDVVAKGHRLLTIAWMLVRALCRDLNRRRWQDGPASVTWSPEGITKHLQPRASRIPLTVPPGSKAAEHPLIVEVGWRDEVAVRRSRRADGHVRRSFDAFAAGLNRPGLGHRPGDFPHAKSRPVFRAS